MAMRKLEYIYIMYSTHVRIELPQVPNILRTRNITLGIVHRDLVDTTLEANLAGKFSETRTDKLSIITPKLFRLDPKPAQQTVDVWWEMDGGSKFYSKPRGFKNLFDPTWLDFSHENQTLSSRKTHLDMVTGVTE